MATKTDKNTLKNLWKKPLVGLLSLSILASISTACFADEKHEQFAEKWKTKVLTEEDVKGWGWTIAAVEAGKLGLDEKELIFKYSKEDLKLIRRLSDIFDTEEKTKQMARIYHKQNADEILTEEEKLMFENYDLAREEVRKMLKQKIKAGEVRSSFEHIEAYDTNDEMMDSISKLYAASQKKKEQAIKTSANEVNAEEPDVAADKLAKLKEAAESIKAEKMTTEEEKLIKEADAFYSNEENQKLLRSSDEEPLKLSKEQEEAQEESWKYLLEFLKNENSMKYLEYIARDINQFNVNGGI